jgi:hypothetical protein
MQFVNYYAQNLIKIAFIFLEQTLYFIEEVYNGMVVKKIIYFDIFHCVIKPFRNILHFISK